MLPSRPGHGNRFATLAGCLSLAACALSSAADVWAQQIPSAAPYPPSAPTLVINTREILLDVQVTDASGHPVPDLKPSDFTVTEEGSPQVIRKVEEHRALSPAQLAHLSAAPVLPPNTFTDFTPFPNTDAVTVILLDATNMPVPAQMYVREQLIRYFKKASFGAPIAIFRMDTRMHLVQGFTSDRQVLLAAAESKRNMPSVARPFEGRGYTKFEFRYENLRDGMRTMGRYLAGFPGRKNLIWFTGKVPLWLTDSDSLSNVFHDSFNLLSEDLPDLTDVLTMSRVAVYPVDSRGLLTDPQYNASSGGIPSTHADMHFGTRQYFDHTKLDIVADSTGGKAFYDTNALDHVIEKVVDNGSNYYTLDYATTNKTYDGQFRHIRITVNRPDVHLQYRPGYYARDRAEQEQRQIAALQRKLTRTAAQPGAPPLQPNIPPSPSMATAAPASGALVHHSARDGFDAAMELGAVPPTEIVFAARLRQDPAIIKLTKSSPLPANNYLQPAWQHKPFRNYTVLFDADSRNITTSQTPDGLHHATVQFVAVLYDAEGSIVNSLDKTAELSLNEAEYRKLLQSGLQLRGEIAVPEKGNFFLRLGIHDVTDDKVGALEVPVDQVKPETASAILQKP